MKVNFVSLVALIGLLSVGRARADEPVEKPGANTNPAPAESTKDAAKEHEFLYPVLGNHKWGLIDGTGKVVVPKQFDGIDPIEGPPLAANINPLLGPVRSQAAGGVAEILERFAVAGETAHGGQSA